MPGRKIWVWLIIVRAQWDVDLHLDGGHVDFEEWLGQVTAKKMC